MDCRKVWSVEERRKEREGRECDDGCGGGGGGWSE